MEIVGGIVRFLSRRALDGEVPCQVGVFPTDRVVTIEELEAAERARVPDTLRDLVEGSR